MAITPITAHITTPTIVPTTPTSATIILTAGGSGRTHVR